MSRGQTQLDHPALVKALNEQAGRKSGTATLLYQLAIADRLGLSLTDLVSGEILARTGTITAGELATLSGLTTGAITGVVDRLEKAGLARRVNDPNDRRRVLLEPVAGRFHTLLGDIYAGLEQRFSEVYKEYSDAELALLLEFLDKSIDIFDKETTRLRTKTPLQQTRVQDPDKPNVEAKLSARVDARAQLRADIHARADATALVQIRRGAPKETRTFFAPRGKIAEARLEWSSGAAHLKLHGGVDMPELYRATFKHDIPIVRDQDGNVSIQYRHRTLFGRGGGDADVILNAATMWEMHLECGASSIDADLSPLTIRGLTLKSNATRLKLVLPPPSGTIRIKLESPMSYIEVERPKQVPVHLEFQGDWSNVRFDRQKLNASNESRESPEYKRATNRYVIELIGSGGKLTVEENKG